MELFIRRSRRLLRTALAVAVALLLTAAVTVTAGAKEVGEEEKMLIPGGHPFGVRFMTDGVLVTNIRSVSAGGKAVSPGELAGIRVGDVIVRANGKDVSSAKEISELVEICGGGAIALTVRRNGKNTDITLNAVKEDGSGIYRAGLELKDSMSGIGTVTYVDPDTLEFGGLGHGICDPVTSVLMPLKSGSAMAVRIGGAVKGKSGRPGEIKGLLLSKRLGSVTKNSECGVFGAFSSLSDAPTPIPVGKRDTVKEGKALIRTTLGDDGVKEYEIEISKINRESTDNKSFVITVTDKALKERTGGIIQGMSGSPIIQNGKLVGAVTHVLVNDPTRGYGIFIENMLNAGK